MESKWSGLREIQEGVLPSRSPMEIKIAHLEEDILDIKQTLAGTANTKHGKALQMELANKEGQLKAIRFGQGPPINVAGQPRGY